MTDRVRVEKLGDVWSWTCRRCLYAGWTREGFSRALEAATRHLHWRDAS